MLSPDGELIAEAIGDNQNWAIFGKVFCALQIEQKFRELFLCHCCWRVHPAMRAVLIGTPTRSLQSAKQSASEA